MKGNIWKSFLEIKEHPKRLLFCTYTKAMHMISRTGIARRFLPLSLRKALGRSLRRLVNAVSSVDTAKPYNVMGHKMWLYPGSITTQEMVYGTYEQDTVKLFGELLKPGMTFVDVGAFIGFYTLLTARLVGYSGKVYAFEPNPVAFEILLRNINTNNYWGIVLAIPKAVADYQGQAQLFLRGEPAEGTLYGNEVSDSVEVATVSLDEFFSAEGWPAVHLVKIDVEGAEIKVLKGMRETVRRNSYLKLVIEFNPGNQIKAVGNYEAIFENLLQLGFNRFYAIWHGVKPISIPQDIPKLIRLAEETTNKCINLICEISEVNQ